MVTGDGTFLHHFIMYFLLCMYDLQFQWQYLRVYIICCLIVKNTNDEYWLNLITYSRLMIDIERIHNFGKIGRSFFWGKLVARKIGRHSHSHKNNSDRLNSDRQLIKVRTAVSISIHGTGIVTVNLYFVKYQSCFQCKCCYSQNKL